MEKRRPRGGKVSRSDWGWAALRVALGGLFIYASLHKIIAPSAFAHEVNNYRLGPGPAVNPFAIVVPWLEFFCGAALILHRWPLGASALVAAMMAAFTVAV